MLFGGNVVFEDNRYYDLQSDVWNHFDKPSNLTQYNEASPCPMAGASASYNGITYTRTVNGATTTKYDAYLSHSLYDFVEVSEPTFSGGKYSGTMTITPNTSHYARWTVVKMDAPNNDGNRDGFDVFQTGDPNGLFLLFDNATWVPQNDITYTNNNGESKYVISAGGNNREFFMYANKDLNISVLDNGSSSDKSVFLRTLNEEGEDWTLDELLNATQAVIPANKTVSPAHGTETENGIDIELTTGKEWSSDEILAGQLIYVKMYDNPRNLTIVVKEATPVVPPVPSTDPPKFTASDITEGDDYAEIEGADSNEAKVVFTDLDANDYVVDVKFKRDTTGTAYIYLKASNGEVIKLANQNTFSGANLLSTITGDGTVYKYIWNAEDAVPRYVRLVVPDDVDYNSDELPVIIASTNANLYPGSTVL